MPHLQFWLHQESRFICTMMDLKNRENSFNSKCFHTDLFPQDAISTTQHPLQGKSAQTLLTAPAAYDSVCRAAGISPARVHAGRQKRWLTQLNRAAYTAEPPLDAGDYKTWLVQVSKRRLPKHLKLCVNAEHVDSWCLGERKKKPKSSTHLKFTRTVWLMKNCRIC